MIPKFIKIKQTFPRPRVDDIAGRIEKELAQMGLSEKILPGQKIAITAGSRGINNIPQILAIVAARVRELGGFPMAVSAMGSHGGGTPAGQRDILASLGITEETIGCPVICSSDVTKLGVTPTHKIDVYCAKEAVEADGVIVINRIKCHTAFRAPQESGLLKMIGIGLGRVPGAEAIHSMGTEHMGQVILELARIVMTKINVLGGLAIVENSYEETEGIYGLKPEEFEEQEAILLKKANGLLPRIPFERIDLLIVNEMGKNYSGTGMDTNVIGRWRIPGVPDPGSPQVKRIAVLDLSEPSHGNANGIGLADFTTKKLVNKINFQATYLNCLTTGILNRVMIPIILENHRKVIETALKTLRLSDISQARVVRIKNTLHLEEMWVSENFREEIINTPGLEIVSQPMELRYNQDGDIQDCLEE
ncbi:MAG: DUF362 domain-containing protein [Bacillota bacterium]